MRNWSDTKAWQVFNEVAVNGVAAIPQAMLAMIARQPLVKLLKQAGIDPKGETAQQLNAALSRIPKNR